MLAATAATTYIPAYLSSGGSTDVPGIAAGFGDALKTTFKAGRGWTGVFYSLSFWESFILGVALVAGPILPTVVSGVQMCLWVAGLLCQYVVDIRRAVALAVAVASCSCSNSI